MNVQDVVTRVKRVFGDEAGVQITDQDIIRWINDAQEEVVLTNAGLMETTGTAPTVANQAVYDLPADYSVLRSLKYNGFRIKPLSFAEFNEYLDGYSSKTNPIYGPGIPDVFMVWEGQVTLFPTPSESTVDGLSIYYMRHPPSVNNLADDLSLPLSYHNSIVDFCLQQAYELDEDYGKAQAKESRFEKSMMKLNGREDWTAREYYPTITTLPEDENFGSYGFWGGYT